MERYRDRLKKDIAWRRSEEVELSGGHRHQHRPENSYGHRSPPLSHKHKQMTFSLQLGLKDVAAFQTPHWPSSAPHIFHAVAISALARRRVLIANLGGNDSSSNGSGVKDQTVYSDPESYGTLMSLFGTTDDAWSGSSITPDSTPPNPLSHMQPSMHIHKNPCPP
ncbi:hypothetical protein WMY93_007787 [Mugilogobius chulae]|uniref:Uncharacterized protein n=1 Tax=Mugilogobius chulae TaxID=88201 RepID=A0AAW0PQH9_9GOBI